MNSGFSEAEALVGSLRKILREHGPLDLLAAYDRDQQALWRLLLGVTGGLKAANEANSWVRERRAKILPCLPSINGDLGRLANQLKLELA